MWRKVGKTLTGNTWRLPLPPNGPGAKCSLVLSELGGPQDREDAAPRGAPWGTPSHFSGNFQGPEASGFSAWAAFNRSQQDREPFLRVHRTGRPSSPAFGTPEF